MRHILLLLFFLLITSTPYAKKIEVTNLSITAGLPSNEVTCMLQDDLGFMWFGTTNGICRYDGYQFKIYRLSDFDGMRMVSNNIRYITKDRNGKLWIVTESSEVLVFDPSIETCTKVGVEGYLKGKINTLLVTESGEILLGTGEGLFKYDEMLSQFIFLKKALVKSLFEDSKGRLWVGTWKTGFFTIDLMTLKTTEYLIGRKDELRVTGFAESKNGYIWISTWDDGGLYCLENPDDPSSTKYKKYLSIGKRPVIPENVMYGVVYDSVHDDLWVATANGLVMFSSPEETEECQYFDRTSLQGGEVWTMCLDRNNTLWVSVMGGGISKLVHKESLFEHYTLQKDTLGEKIVTALYEDEDSCLWIGVRKDVLLQLDRKTGRYTSYKEIDLLDKLPENCNAIQTIVKEKNTENLWLGTRYDGIYVVERKNRKIVSVEKLADGSLHLRTINSMDVDSDGRIWIGTEQGLYVAERRGMGGDSLYSVITLNERIENGNVLTVNCDKEGTWIGTMKYGAFLIDSNGNIRDYHLANDKLNSNNVSCFYRDSQKQFWIGTQGGGISRYNEKNDCFDILDNVRMFSDDMIYSMTEDDKQNLWITTGRGLVCLSLSDKDYVIWYNQNDGLRNLQFIRGALLRLSSSDILFGGYNSIDSYVSALNNQKDTVPSPVYIVDISIMNIPLSEVVKENTEIAADLPPYTGSVTLPYDRNNVMFSFSCLSYINPQANRYAYRMEGIDKDWIYVDANNRYISYNNMTSGSYRFEVKASNEHGIWSVPNVIQLTVLPAPWFTWWAYCGYIVFFALSTYIAIRMMQRRISLQNALKIEQIERRKSEEVNQAKLKFFTNVSHELFTPISVLQCSIDRLRLQELSDTETLGIMKVNLQRLQRLLQQILEFRKVESGNLKLKVSRNDIVAFAKKLCEENFNPLVQARQITLHFSSEPDSIMAYFDIDKLDKILYNLLSNALKYNYQQGIISVSVSEICNPNQRNIALTVENTGDGIPSSKLPLLFKRFYEGDYRKFKTHGTGLGLSLTKDLVDLHHGTITVHSVPGETTVFTIILPADRDAYAFDQIEETMDEVSKVHLPEIKEEALDEKNHLLLVEDDIDLLTVMTKVLSIYFEVHTAANGVEALEVLRYSEQIEIVITDYVMPRMNGMELCKSIREDSSLSCLPIIMLTAKTQIEHQLEGYQAGVDVYIPKPVEMSVLVAQVKAVISNRKLFLEKFRQKDDMDTRELGLPKPDQEFLDKSIAIVEQHIDNAEFSNETFGELMNMSQSTLYRKLKSLTGMSANEFIRNIRIKKACLLLQNANLQVSDIAYMVGFTDPKYFGLIFKKEKGMSPSKYIELMKK